MMRSTANDMDRDALVRSIIEHIPSWYLRGKTITRSTRLFHDLNLYEEWAEWLLEDLQNIYKFKHDGFDFDRYFPPQVEGRNVFERMLHRMMPFLQRRVRAPESFAPFTIGMLERWIIQGYWSEDITPERGNELPR